MRKNILIQRSVLHYRVPVLNELERRAPGAWVCLSSNADKGKEDGIRMQQESIRTHYLGRYCFIFGIGLARKKAQVVVLEGSLNILTNIPFMLWCRILGVPVVLWTKGMRQDRKPRSFFNRLYENVVHSLASGFLVYGVCSEHYLLAKGIRKELISIAQNSIDTESILQKQAQRPVPVCSVSSCVFGYMGRLCADKNVELALLAFKEFLKSVKDSNISSRLLIAGDGPMRESLEAMIMELGLTDSVQMLGRIPVGQEERFFNAIDVSVSVQSHGLGIPEAMAYGKVVLLTPEDGPEAESVIDGKTGLISKNNTPAAIAGEMLRLAENAPLRQKIAEQAVDYVRNKLGISHMVDAIEASVSKALRQ